MANHSEVRSSKDGDERVQVVCFCVGEQHFALDIMRIKEIIHPIRVTRVPGTPNFIEGIVELRGAFMAVVDLRKRFGDFGYGEGQSGPAVGRDAKYVVVRMGADLVALIVDRVIDVRRWQASDIRPAPGIVIGTHSRFVVGVVRGEDHIVMVVDLDAIFSHREESSLRDATARAKSEPAKNA